MNKIKSLFLRASAVFFAAVAALTIGLTSGNWLGAFVLFFALDCAMATVRGGFCFANSLGTLSSSLIVQEALALVFTERPILKNISLNLVDLDGNVAQVKKGQSVITRLKSIPSVGNFGDAASAAADTDVTVTLSNFKQIEYTFTAAEISSTNRNLIAERARPMAVAMANYFVDTISAIWTIGNFPARTGADAVANAATITKTIKGAGWDYTHLLQVGQTLDNAGVPSMSRFYVANSAVYASLLSDLRIVAALNNPDNAGAIKSGKLPEVNNFGIMKYPAIPTTGNMVAFAGTPDSTAFAVRPPVDPKTILPNAPSIMNSGYITDPATGLTVRVDEWIGTDLSATVRISWLDGSAVGNANNGQLIVTQ